MIGFTLPSIPQISAEETKRLMDEKRDLLLLDVRTPEEHAKARITGSINIPLDRLDEAIESHLINAGNKLIVYCLSGSRSIQAVADLQAAGYKDVFNLTSGLLAWRGKNFPLES